MRRPGMKIIFFVGFAVPVLFYAAGVVKVQELGGHGRAFVSRSKAPSEKGNKQKVVVLYSNQRSGSSFMGEIFNRNPQAFYLYEPLFPFTPHCNWLNRERVEALEEMLKCGFANNSDVFKSAQQVTLSKDSSTSSCVRNGICFASNSEAIRGRYRERCKTSFPKSDCTLPPRLDVVSKMCSEARIVAYKVLRVCSLAEMDELHRKLSTEGKEFYVVHLVRDPRAIISSKLHLQLDAKDTLERTLELCKKMDGNLKFIHNNRDVPALVKTGRYLRVRYEDAATNPVKTARDIYRFIKLELAEEVESWLNMSTLTAEKRKQELMDRLKDPGTNKKLLADEYAKMQKQLRNPYATVKDPSTTVQKWRSHLKIGTVQKIQEKCADVLDRLKYKQVSSEGALLNLSVRLW